MGVPEHDHAAAIAAEVDLSAGSADLVRGWPPPRRRPDARPASI